MPEQIFASFTFRRPTAVRPRLRSSTSVAANVCLSASVATWAALWDMVGEGANILIASSRSAATVAANWLAPIAPQAVDAARRYAVAAIDLIDFTAPVFAFVIPLLGMAGGTLALGRADLVEKWHRRAGWGSPFHKQPGTASDMVRHIAIGKSDPGMSAK